MGGDTKQYLETKSGDYREVCEQLQAEIGKYLPDAENKVWHAHPVWFLAGNPIVGYSVQKPGVRLMFWSGMGFDEPELQPGTGKFKDASIFYQSANQINTDDIKRWCEKARRVQWNYRDLVKNKGRLERLV